MESLFEELGGIYTLAEDGMYYPALSIPKSESSQYGKYGRMRLCYLQEHWPLVFHDLVLHVKLTEHLNEIDEIENIRMELLIHQMQEQQGITEDLKVCDQMAWVGAMNNIYAAAEGIVCAEVIFG